MNQHHRPTAVDHTAELAMLRARVYSPDLSALEAAAMLAAIELLRAHERDAFEICENPSCLTLLTLCLGTRFERVHGEDDLDDCTCCCHE